MKPTLSLTGQFFLYRFYAFPQQKLIMRIKLLNFRYAPKENGYRTQAE